MMPIDLVLVRHGECEGNVVTATIKRGDDSLCTDEYLNRHSSLWRLTDKGRKQAVDAGEWLRKNVGPDFDRHLVSEYVRALETAALLDLPAAEWYRDMYLRERDWGQLDVITHEERFARWGDELKRRDRDGLYWAPPGGENMANLCLRVDRVIQTLHRECAGKKIVVVCHGEVMWAFRLRLERMTQAKYWELDISKNPRNRIHNCQVLHYTRRDPQFGNLVDHLNWFRSVCPWDMNLSLNNWVQIERKKFSNQDLLNEIKKIPRLVT